MGAYADFVRTHGIRNWTAALLVVIALAMGYALVLNSSEVIRWERHDVVVVSRNVTPNSKHSTYEYRTTTSDGREFRFRHYSMLNIGEHVLIEESIRRNGHSMLRFIAKTTGRESHSLQTDPIIQ